MAPSPARPAELSPAPRPADPLVGYGGSGHERRTGPDYRWDCRLRREPPHIVLQLTLAGCGYIVQEGGPTTLLPRNHAFFQRIPGPFEYGWHPSGGGVYELLFVSVRGAVADAVLARVHAAHGSVLDFGDDLSVAAAMRQVVDAAPREAGRDRFLLSARLYGLLMTVLSALDRSRVASVPLADRALRLMREHAPDPSFNVAALARLLDCSREHLARGLRRATGMTPIALLTQQRLRLAGTRLREGEEKLERVARASGFSSAAYLCRVFRKVVGVSPDQYRRRPWLSVP